MPDITLAEAWAWLLAAAAAVVTLSKVWDLFMVKLKPGRDLRNARIARHAVAANTDKLDRDKKRLDELDKANTVIFQALYALINHEISGNGDDVLRDARDKLQEYLANRH